MNGIGEGSEDIEEDQRGWNFLISEESSKLVPKKFKIGSKGSKKVQNWFQKFQKIPKSLKIRWKNLKNLIIASYKRIKGVKDSQTKGLKILKKLIASTSKIQIR